MNPGTKHPDDRQRGIALVVVLWIVTLLALQVSIFNLTVRDAAALAGNELAAVRGEALAAAGVEMAAARLMEREPGAPMAGQRRLAHDRARRRSPADHHPGRVEPPRPQRGQRRAAGLAAAAVRAVAGNADPVGRQDPRLARSRQRAAAAGRRGHRLSARRRGLWAAQRPVPRRQRARPRARHPRQRGSASSRAISRSTAARARSTRCWPRARRCCCCPAPTPWRSTGPCSSRRDGASASWAASLALAQPMVHRARRPDLSCRGGRARRGHGAAIGRAEAVILVGMDAATPFRVLSWRYGSVGARRAMAERT